MSETSESESPKTRGGLRPRITLWSSLAIVFIIAIMAIFLVTNPVDQSDEPPAAQETTAPVDDESGECDVPAGDTSATPDMPDDLRWEAENGWTWPVSDTYGPTQDENGYGVCFARSPLGAALMAVTLTSTSNTVGARGAVDVYAVDSQGKTAAQATLGDAPAATTPVVFAGFVVDSFTPEEVQLTVVLATDNSATGYAGIPETFEWVDGDWKVKLLDDGSFFAGQPTNPTEGEFVKWGVNGG